MARLAAAIMPFNMKTIAALYLDMGVQTTAAACREDQEEFKREVLQAWANKNPVDQVKVRSCQQQNYRKI